MATHDRHQAQQFRDLRAHNAYRAHVEQLRQHNLEHSRRVQRILELNRHRIMELRPGQRTVGG